MLSVWIATVSVLMEVVVVSGSHFVMCLAHLLKNFSPIEIYGKVLTKTENSRITLLVVVFCLYLICVLVLQYFLKSKHHWGRGNSLRGYKRANKTATGFSEFWCPPDLERKSNSKPF